VLRVATGRIEHDLPEIDYRTTASQSASAIEELKMIANCNQIRPHPSAFCLPISAFCLLLSAFCLSPSGCASYQFGNATLFPPDIHTVYVPMVESNSFRPNLGEALTEAVCKQIEKETPYKVVGNPNADSILTVKLIQDTKRVYDSNKFDEARATQVNYQAQITWANRKGDIVYNGAVPLPPQFVNIGQSAAYIPEYGQSYSTSEYQVVDKLAMQIVGLMEKPW
jgi:hypothetical protein